MGEREGRRGRGEKREGRRGRVGEEGRKEREGGRGREGGGRRKGWNGAVLFLLHAATATKSIIMTSYYCTRYEVDQIWVQ